MTSYVELPQDREKLDPKQLANRLKTDFKSYYDTKKVVLDRRKLDIAALKARAGIKENNLPAVTNNVIGKLYNA